MQPRTTTAFLLGLFVFSQLLFPANAAPTRTVGRSVSLAPAAPSSQGLSVAGHVGGMPQAVTVNATYLYAGLGSELTILDIADPTAPSQAGRILLGMIQKLVVVDNRLYVAADKLYILDITNPAAPAMPSAAAALRRLSSSAAFTKMEIDRSSFIAIASVLIVKRLVANPSSR